MAVVASRRSVMTLYSRPLDIYSHQVRIVLAEKGVSVDILDAHQPQHAEDLATLNPYGSIPTLVDRDLVVFHPRIIMEYLDERFPHPPLMPVYPVVRAQCRLMMHRIEKDWYQYLPQIDPDNLEGSLEARKALKESVLSMQPLLEEQPYFMGEEFTLVDCWLAPLLWRFPLYGINIPKQAKRLQAYADRLFDRDAFQASLSESERELLTLYQTEGI